VINRCGNIVMGGNHKKEQEKVLILKGSKMKYRGSHLHRLLLSPKFRIQSGLTFIAHPSDGHFDYLILEDEDDQSDILAMEMVELRQTRLPKHELRSDGCFWLTDSASTASVLEAILAEPYILKSTSPSKFTLECLTGKFEGSSRTDVFCKALVEKFSA